MKKNVVGFPQLETTNVGASQLKTTPQLETELKTAKKTKQVLFKVFLLVVAIL